MSHFAFMTRWQLPIAQERVWSILNQPQHFPQWWPGFEHVKILKGKGEQGTIMFCRVRGSGGLRFDFMLTVKLRQPPKRLLLQASGDFVGQGEWLLKAHQAGTEVIYDWKVAVRPFWARALASLPGMRRYLTKSHDRVMERGRQRLEELLRNGA